MHIRPFQLTDEEAVITLWDQCGFLRPWNNPLSRNHAVGREVVAKQIFAQGEE